MHFLKRNFWDVLIVLIILALCVFISFKNFTPGTWLLGWDDLVPELNFKLNIARSLSATWQEYQGLGLLGGMGHAADLPRQIILLVLSVFIPTSFLRYLWTFLMLFIGPLGVYLIVSRGLTDKQAFFASRAAGVAAAIFYIFNLATLQTFYTPFETFIGFYGFLPWLLWCSLDYLKGGQGKKLLVFALASAIGAAAFYVQTMFVVYAVFLLIIALEAMVKYGKSGIFRSIKLGFVTLIINSFWLLPVLYFSATSASVPANSHINQIATPETQLMNLAKADFNNIAALKGYWFDYFDWNKNGQYEYLYKPWMDYLARPEVENTSIVLFVAAVTGLILALFKKKTSFAFSFLAILGISYYMLDGGTFSWIPFFSEIFRNAFTKWANAAAFTYSVGLGLLVFLVSDLIKSKFKYFMGAVAAVAVISASVFTALPMIQGNLIAKSMRVELPSYYSSVIDFFNNQDSTKRIADFPLTDHWGWKFTDWGYRGSWFLWYAIPQPMLDRTFDVWSPYNEQFYKEIAHAVEIQNYDELKYILNKFQVSYILFDQSVFEPGNLKSQEKMDKQENFIRSAPFISKVQQFGKVAIYEFNLADINSFVGTPKTDYSLPYISTGNVIGEPALKEKFPAEQGYPEAKNCDTRLRGEVVKKKVDGGDYYMASNDGVSCDYFYYPTLDYSKAYQMRLTGNNISGRSLKFYLYNPKLDHVEMEEILPSGSFDKSYVILPTESSASAGLGYTLSVETRSFGNQKSENWMTGIEFTPLEYHVANQPASVSNNLTIDNVQKYGTWAYKVDVLDSGLIQLGQGYDDGWVAFRAKDFSSARTDLPVLEHTKVNSWSNGWIVPDNPNYPVATYYLVYWPQMLEWGGMALGVLTLIFLIL